MLENSFDLFFSDYNNNDKNLRYWRNKIQNNIKNSSRERGRIKSCEIVEDLTQLGIFCRLLKLENKNLLKDSQNFVSKPKNHIEKFSTFDNFQDEENKLITDVSTPISAKSFLDNNDTMLITFKPGANWSENKSKKKHFPRDVFTRKKLF